MISYLLLRYGVNKELFVALTNGIYNFFVVLAVAAGLVLVYRALRRLGHEKARLALFFIVIAVIILPAGYASSRAANIFYQPRELWSFELLWEIVTTQSYHTFHASLLLPTILISALIVAMRFRYFEIADTFFLYIPLANAIGRIACFLVGCCWGRYIDLSSLGLSFGFYNPVPLYDIAYNIGIFLILKKIHARIYPDGSAGGSPPEAGKVSALYLILYGDARFLIEFMRTEEIAAFGLTQAQWAMTAFIAIGAAILAGIYARTRFAGLAREQREQTIRIMYAAGLALYYLIGFAIAGFLVYDGIVEWPLRPVNSVPETYGRILIYLPVFVLQTLAILVLFKLRIPVAPSFSLDPRRLLNPYFIICMIGSAAYSIALFSVTTYSIRGIAFWPPVIIMSLLNAFAEEAFFRLTFFTLLHNAVRKLWIANIGQALLYSIVHLAVGGPLFCLYSFVYGLVLGMVRERTQSIIPCMLCHFIIDIGVIGFPLMQYCTCWYK